MTNEIQPEIKSKKKEIVKTKELIRDPSIAEQAAQDKELHEVVGRAAIITAHKFGLPFVWSLKTTERVPIEKAEEIIKKNPGLIYFDFDALASIIKANEDMESESSPSEHTELTEPEAESPNPDLLDDRLLDDRFEVIPCDLADGETIIESIGSPTDKKPLTRYGCLTTYPGLEVYVNPSGIIRVSIEGPIRIQKIKTHDTRVIRITRHEKKDTKLPIKPSPSKLEDDSDY